MRLTKRVYSPSPQPPSPPQTHICTNQDYVGTFGVKDVFFLPMVAVCRVLRTLVQTKFSSCKHVCMSRAVVLCVTNLPFVVCDWGLVGSP